LNIIEIRRKLSGFVSGFLSSKIKKEDVIADLLFFVLSNIVMI